MLHSTPIGKNRLISRLGRVCLIICLFYAIYVPLSQPQTAYGTQTVVTDPVNVDKCKFLQIVEDGSYLFVLSNRPSECVLVFDMDGDYQCSYHIYNESKGSLQLAAENGRLLVADAKKNVYIFENNQFVRFLPAQDAAHILSAYDFGRTQEKYEIKFVSVWRNNGQNSECVIQRSAYAALEQYHLHIFALLFLSIGLGIYRCAKPSFRDSRFSSR